MKKEIDLTPFCGDAGRYELDKPFVFEEWEYATDGRIAVRTPSDRPDTQGVKLPRSGIVAIFAEQDFSACCKFWPNKLYHYTDGECSYCNQTGYLGGHTCNECGHFNPEKSCPACKGEPYGLSQDAQNIGGAWLQRTYDEKIRRLGDVRYARVEDATILFRTLGVSGIVKEWDATHIVKEPTK